MSRRFYSNTAAQAITTNSLNNTDSTSTISLTVPLAGWPSSTPFLAALDKGTATEEIVRVTAVSGSNLTADRGYDNSPKRTHGIGATLQHVAAAIDYDEANAHVNNNSGVHGVTGSVVGTTDAQTLTNKTLTQPVIGDLTQAQHDHSSAAHGGNIPQASVTGLVAAIAAAETSAAHSADMATVVHLAGTETVTGAKTFSAATHVTGGLTVTAAGSNVPTTPGATGLKQYFFTQAFTYSNQNGKSVALDWSAAGFASVVNIQITVIAGSNFNLGARLDSGYSTTTGNAWTYSSTGANITGSFTLHVTVTGT